MTAHALTGPAPPELGARLEDFEREFLYPLGPDARFRISHSVDYLTFFQAIGNAVLHVVEHQGAVAGTLARVERRVEVRRAGLPVEEITAHYLGDLKVRPAARGSRVLAALIAAAREGIPRCVSPMCYAVVMDGTGRLPVDYTGRLGVPRFQKTGSIMILRLTARDALPEEPGIRQVDAAEFDQLRRRLARPGHTLTGDRGSGRSLMEPVPLADAGGLACGRLEDTRRGKRLFLESGPELLSAHLSGLAYASPEAAARLLRAALARANGLGIPALFAAVPSREADALLPFLSGLEIQPAPASIHSHGFLEDADWWMDTAEI